MIMQEMVRVGKRLTFQWSCTAGQHNNSGSRMVNSARREMGLEKKENETEWQSPTGRLVGGSMAEAGGDERAEVQCNMNKKAANSGGNYMKRRMKSGPEIYHQHWKRR